MTSLSTCEKRSKLRVVQDLLLKALKPILSVPKKFVSVWTNALVAQACPEGDERISRDLIVHVLRPGHRIDHAAEKLMLDRRTEFAGQVVIYGNQL